MRINSDADFCENLAAPIGSAFRYATYKLPESQRRAMHAIQAMHVELDNVLHTIAEPHVAKARLDWWQGELDRIEAGSAAHPISKALIKARQAHELPLEYLRLRLEGAQMDIQYTGYRTEQDLAQYLSQTGGSIWQLFGRVLGLGREADEPLHRLGTLSRRLRLLQYFGRDLASGRIYLPSTYLEAHGVKPADLMLPSPPDTVHSLFEEEAARLARELNELREALPIGENHAQRRLLLPARVILATDLALLSQIRKDGTRVLERRHELPPIKLLWISFMQQWR